jgi:hypothetical protein
MPELTALPALWREEVEKLLGVAENREHSLAMEGRSVSAERCARYGGIRSGILDCAIQLEGALSAQAKPAAVTDAPTREQIAMAFAQTAFPERTPAALALMAEHYLPQADAVLELADKWAAYPDDGTSGPVDQFKFAMRTAASDLRRILEGPKP